MLMNRLCEHKNGMKVYATFVAERRTQFAYTS